MEGSLEDVLSGAATWCVLCADCRDVLPTLPTGYVNALVTDPPYGIGLSNHDTTGHRRDDWDTVIGDHDGEIGNHLIEWGRGQNITLAVFASPWEPWPGRWRNLIAWDKGGAVGGGGDTSKCLKRSWELLQIWNPNDLCGGRGESVWRFPLNPSDTRDHICAKPLGLMQRIVETFTAKDDVILDGCAGSGTTGKACLLTGRRFIGIEVSPQYAELARKRLRETMPLFSAPKIVQGDLFREEA